MAILTIGSETRRYMVWICCVIIIICMASVALIGSSVIITIMTGCTIDAGVSPKQFIIVVMNRECCRLPAGIGSVTCLTIRRYSYSLMIGICCRIVCCLVTAFALCRRSCKSALMAA